MKILVADDSTTVRRLVSTRLKADGHEVLEAEDGEQAVAFAAEDRPDLIVLDKMMPKLDGFEVVRRLRENEATAHIPIIMLTDRASEEDVLHGLDLGVADYMPKPFSPLELSARVKRTLASQ
jgi:two-component system, OmpR family, alkaline phosphatase synthesis response regulator PhoP